MALLQPSLNTVSVHNIKLELAVCGDHRDEVLGFIALFRVVPLDAARRIILDAHGDLSGEEKTC